MLGRGMSVQQAQDAIHSDVETAFAAAGLLDDTPQQKPGLRVLYIVCSIMSWNRIFVITVYKIRLCWLLILIGCCQVIRELIKPPNGKWKQLFGGDANLGRLNITAAEFRQLVPQQDLQVRQCCTSTSQVDMLNLERALMSEWRSLFDNQMYGAFVEQQCTCCVGQATKQGSCL